MVIQLALTPEVTGMPELKQQTRDLIHSRLPSRIFLCGRVGGVQGLEDVPEVLGHQWEGCSPALPPVGQAPFLPE